ncbi:hypothetical protein [Robertkochia solimangrovi]|uniref:hypothetical protein n=1 Tax=Robertkochia solimangrovi TaxID=2213046 RepID=UPI00117EC88D|nr:hypothetical protein [Robertkochia solimangrovi]TRZ42439.1 hypothetical protein DMZ48_13065 [Robertkochia solimangrovi]
MKGIFRIIVIAFALIGCSSDDDEGIDCALFDPVIPELYIRFVDENGVNLIEKGTIDPENSIVSGDFPNPDFYYIPANENLQPESEFRNYDPTLLLYIPGETTFLYTFDLNDTHSVNLEFKADYTELPCSMSFYVPTELAYNDQIIALEDTESSLRFLIDITL